MVKLHDRGKAMNAIDMVYNETYKGCLKVGCIETVAKDTAVQTLQKYKNNQFTKVSTLISSAISDAKKLVINKRKAKSLFSFR